MKKKNDKTRINKKNKKINSKDINSNKSGIIQAKKQQTEKNDNKINIFIAKFEDKNEKDLLQINSKD